jgi:predicted phosphodiesterase
MKIAVLADIHGNLEALEAVLADIRQQGITELICIGDLVGYGPNPQEVVNLIRRLGIRTSMGNHELGIAIKSERKWFNPKARQILGKTEKLLNTESLHFLANLPPSHTQWDGLFVHGFPPESLKTYLFEMGVDEIGEYFKTARSRVVFVGHTHLLELVTWDGQKAARQSLGRGEKVLDKAKSIVNVGSVGQPRDGDNHAKYVVWEPGKGVIDVRFVAYDIQATVDKILARGFPEYYALRLW